VGGGSRCLVTEPVPGVSRRTQICTDGRPAGSFRARMRSYLTGSVGASLPVDITLTHAHGHADRWRVVVPHARAHADTHRWGSRFLGLFFCASQGQRGPASGAPFYRRSAAGRGPLTGRWTGGRGPEVERVHREEAFINTEGTAG